MGIYNKFLCILSIFLFLGDYVIFYLDNIFFVCFLCISFLFELRLFYCRGICWEEEVFG